MMHDRAGGENLIYTHEFLADVLGTSRTSVTLSARALQSEGLIIYRWGNMQVLDRSRIEKASCEC
jgi:biotin operon repressor